MAKKRSGRTHVFSSAFDLICSSYGPDKQGNKHLADLLCRDVRTIRDWRAGSQACPRWAFELVRLTLDERRRTLEEMTGKYRIGRQAYKFGSTRLSIALDCKFGTSSANDGFAIVELPELSCSDSRGGSSGA